MMSFASVLSTAIIVINELVEKGKSTFFNTFKISCAAVTLNFSICGIVYVEVFEFPDISLPVTFVFLDSGLMEGGVPKESRNRTR